MAQQERVRALEQRMWQAPEACVVTEAERAPPSGEWSNAEDGDFGDGVASDRERGSPRGPEKCLPGEGAAHGSTTKGAKRAREAAICGQETSPRKQAKVAPKAGCLASVHDLTGTEEEVVVAPGNGATPSGDLRWNARNDCTANGSNNNRVAAAIEERISASQRQASASLLTLGARGGCEIVSSGSRRKFSHPLDRFASELALWVEDEMVGSLSQLARVNLGVPRDHWARAAWRSAMAMEHSVLCMPIRHRRRLYTLMRQISETSPGVGPAGVGLSKKSSAEQGGGVPPSGDLRSNPENACAAKEDLREHPGDGCTAKGLATASLSHLEQLRPAESFVALAASTADHLVPELGMTLGHLSAFHILHARTQYVKHRDLDAHLDDTDLMHPAALAKPIATDVVGPGRVFL
jgi:hypothetical protein